jgi:hypothetical protein
MVASNAWTLELVDLRLGFFVVFLILWEQGFILLVRL